MNRRSHDTQAVALGAVALATAAPALVALAAAAGVATLSGYVATVAVGGSALAGVVAAARSGSTDREYFDGALGAVFGLALLSGTAPVIAAILGGGLGWPLAGLVFVVGAPMILTAPLGAVVGGATGRVTAGVRRRNRVSAAS